MKIEVCEQGDISVLKLEPSEGESPNGVPTNFDKLKTKVLELSTRAGVRKIIVDLREIHFLDSSCIGVLVGGHRRMKECQGAIIYVGIGLRVAETLNIVNLLYALPIRITCEEAALALKKFQGGRDPGELAKDNPPLETIRAWWDALLHDRVRSIPTPSREFIRKPVLEPRPEPSRAAGGTASTLTPRPASGSLDASHPAGDSNGQPIFTPPDDWNRALGLMREAAALARANGVAFSVDMSFREYVGALAERLVGEE